MELTPDKIVELCALAAGADDPANRMLLIDHKPGCWQRYIERVIRPLHQWGIKRFLLHSPGGSLPGKDFEFDQFIHARDAGLDWLFVDFVDAWARFRQFDPKTELICYLGKIPGDRDFDPGDANAFNRRAEASLELPLAAGMSIGFDACVGEPPSSLTRKLVESVAKRTRVYVEGYPTKEQEHWADFNVIAGIENMHRGKLDGWGVPIERLRGELVRLVNNPPAGHTFAETGWELDYYGGLLTEGYPVCAAFSRLREQRLLYRHLVQRVK